MIETRGNNDLPYHESREVNAETLELSCIAESVGGSYNACVLEGERRKPADESGMRFDDKASVLHCNADSSAPILTDSEMRELPLLRGPINEGGFESSPNLYERGLGESLTRSFQRVNEAPQDIVCSVEGLEGRPGFLKPRSPVVRQDLTHAVATAVIAESVPLVQCNRREFQEAGQAETPASGALQPLYNTCQQSVADGGRTHCLNSIAPQSHELVVTEGSGLQTTFNTTAGGVPVPTDAAMNRQGEAFETTHSAIPVIPASMESSTRASDNTVVLVPERLSGGQGSRNSLPQTWTKEATTLPLPENRESRFISASLERPCLSDSLVDPDDDTLTSCKDLLSVVVDCCDVTDGSASDGPSSEPVRESGDRYCDGDRTAAPRWLWNHSHSNEEDTSSQEHLPVTRSRLRWESRDLFGSKRGSVCSAMALVKPFLFGWAPTQRLDWEESDMSDAGKEPSGVHRRAASQRAHGRRVTSKAAGFPLKRPCGGVNGEAPRKQSNRMSASLSSVSVEGCFGAKVQIRKRKASFTKNGTEGSYAGHHGKSVDDDATVTHMSLTLAAQLYPTQLLQFFVDRELRATQTQERPPGATPDGPPHMGSMAVSRKRETERSVKDCSCPCQGRCGSGSHRNFSEHMLSSSASASFSSFADQRGQSCDWGCSCSPTGRDPPSSSVYHNHYAGASFYLLVSDIKSASPEALGTLLSTSAQPIHLGPNLTNCSSSQKR